MNHVSSDERVSAVAEPEASKVEVAQQDCLSCRVTGTVVCLGLSAYLAAQNYARPSSSPAHRAFTLAFAGGFAALGIARALI